MLQLGTTGSTYQDSWGSMMPGVQRCQNTPISAVLQLEESWAAEWSAPGLRLSAPLHLCPSEKAVDCLQVWGEEINVLCRNLHGLTQIMHLYFTNGLCNPVINSFNLLLETKTTKLSPFYLQTQKEEENLFFWHFSGINGGWERCVEQILIYLAILFVITLLWYQLNISFLTQKKKHT